MESSTNPPLRAALLDFDGTLADSNDAHARAWVETCHRDGLREVTFEQVRPLIGMGGDKLLEALLNLASDDPRSLELREQRGTLFLERYLAEVEPFPRVRDLLTHLRAMGLTLIVATSARSDEFTRMAQHIGIDDLIDGASSSDDADESKPAPDIVEASLKLAGCAPNQAFLLGDTPYDAAAAARAGVAFIGVRCGGWPAHELAALAVYDDPADLVARWSTTPLAQRCPNA